MKLFLRDFTRRQLLIVTISALGAFLVLAIFEYMFNKEKSKKQQMKKFPVLRSLMSKKTFDVTDPTTIKESLDDVIGIDEYKAEVREIINMIRSPSSYVMMGATLPKGILLTGPPGCGKTMLARAIAKEAGCSFIAADGSAFDETFVGVGAERVRTLFETAGQNKPCIVFIDEIDSIAGKRSKDHRFLRQAMNMLLTSMDGFADNSRIMVIGATNIPESLDPAILRAGRFDRIVEVPYPSKDSRSKLFELYFREIITSFAFRDIDVFVNRTAGFTGADIMNLARSATLNAIRHGRDSVTVADLDAAYDRKLMGLTNKKATHNEKHLASVAYHEAGHTLVHLLNKRAGPLHKVTILGRGSSLGHTAFTLHKEYAFDTFDDYMKSIQVGLGGRVAEELWGGLESRTIGSGSDFENVSSIAYQAISRFGFAGLEFVGDSRDLSEQKAKKIDDRVEVLIREQFEKTRELLKNNWHLVDKVAKGLLERETLSREEVRQLIGF